MTSLLRDDVAQRIVELRTILAPNRAPLDEVAGEVLDLSPRHAIREVVVREQTRIAGCVVDQISRVFATCRIPDGELRARGVIIRLAAQVGKDRRDVDVLIGIESDVRREVGMRATVFNPELRAYRDRVIQRGTRLVPLCRTVI